MSSKIIVNLFGGSGYGKSTCAAYIYSKIKKEGIKTELVFEYAKDLIYLSNITPPFNQAFVFGNQLFKIEQYLQQSEILIVDSPLLLSIVYNKTPYLKEHFSKTVMDAFNHFNNINYLLDNKFTYENHGRYQNEEAARESHRIIKDLLCSYEIPYKSVTSNDYDLMIEEILNCYKKIGDKNE